MHVIVICAGRTGSLSMKVALEELYKGSCYHFNISSIPPEEHFLFLERQMKESVTKEEWKSFYDQFCAAVGSPVAAYWRELIEVYPNAKVIVMQRESDGWYKSMLDTNITLLNNYGTLAYGISLLFYPSGAHTLSSYVRYCYNRMFGVYLTEDKEAMIECYENFYENLRNGLDSKNIKYLNFQVQDGWKPLCDFLDVEIPNESFPKCLQHKDYLIKLKNIKRKGAMASNVVKFLVIPIVALLAFYITFS